ncbi:hypothetical protein CC86DRAFT_153802 [Ophiobolus disseminans]|uniref:Uncharacterized protein n=1 Tax=Ophiobolus disseminans TaxID=1469910 RepID=A0A6A6ZCL1_9PLEO|nr:hypothetical protein CC86DRAFT_153802 [Ophiobolus disseminans]
MSHNYKKKRPPAGTELDPDRADARCPARICTWATKAGKKYMVFDCENLHSDFCVVSWWPWCPSGNPDKPVPPVSQDHWTPNTQRAWQYFMRECPFYTPPYEPLPFTIDPDEPYVPNKPVPSTIRFRSPN